MATQNLTDKMIEEIKLYYLQDDVKEIVKIMDNIRLTSYITIHDANKFVSQHIVTLEQRRDSIMSYRLLLHFKKRIENERKKRH